MENNEILEGELVEEIQGSCGNGMKTVAIVGVSAAVGALLWDRLIKPMWHRIKAKSKDVKPHQEPKRDDGVAQKSSGK
jgi:hypothetical protein